ncbi:MAG: hypothetical protein PHE17_17930, partial [Thiothrix sp.]|uniref:hypothetical protein n=1 Tax=Thiothrix sp. TaxID=1032 RepID=UPI002607B7F1
VGAYGAGTKKDKAAARLKYARKVWKVLDRQVAQGLGKQPEPEPVATIAADASQQPKQAVVVRHQRGILVVELE